MRPCSFYDGIKSTATDVVLFSVIGTPLSRTFNLTSGSLFGAYKGLLNPFIRPLTATMFNTDQKDASSVSKAAAQVVEYIAEVGIATYLTTKTYSPVSFADAAVVNFLPFVLRSFIESQDSNPKPEEKEAIIQKPQEQEMSSPLGTSDTSYGAVDSSPLYPLSPDTRNTERKSLDISDVSDEEGPSNSFIPSIELTVKEGEFAVLGKQIARIGKNVLVIGKPFKESTRLPIYGGLTSSLTTDDLSPFTTSSFPTSPSVLTASPSAMPVSTSTEFDQDEGS